ncbi:MAG: TSUP family transporter [Verrucomicrobiales bacterium]
MELPFDATWTTIAIALAGAFCLGVAKTGFPGLAIVNVLIVAELFGAKNSVGIILPLLIVCDLIVYPLFRKYASWRQVWPLIPVIMIGVVIGYFLLDNVEEITSRRLIGVIVLLMLVLQLFREYKKDFLEHLPVSKTFFVATGLTIGISTILANAAGSVYSIYALVKKMSKEDFLGIGARIFLLVNVLKIPFLTDLNLINADSLLLNVLLLPGIAAGIFLGKTLIRIVPQRAFEILLYVFSLIAGVKLLFF